MRNLTLEDLESRQIWKNAFITFFKTILYIVTAIGLVIASTFVMNPNFSLKINNFLGMSKAENTTYEKIYKESGENKDLYNLIMSDEKLGYYKNELLHINELIAKDDYDEFCTLVNNLALQNIESTTLIPYNCDLNMYLMNRKVTCLYVLGESLNGYIYNQTKNGKLTDVTFATYIDLINNDSSKTKAEKTALVTELFSLATVDGGALVDFDELLQNKITLIENAIAEKLSYDKAVILQYSLTRICKAGYIAGRIISNEEITDKYYDKYVKELKNLSEDKFLYEK